MSTRPDHEKIDHHELRVLIVATMGAHQKAIRAMCASIPQSKVIDTVSSTPQAIEMVRNNHPNLIIMGANLPERRACEFLDQLEMLPDPPYCIVLTASEYGTCFDRHVSADRIISTATFANRLPEILNRV